jgi:hypothetical protein
MEISNAIVAVILNLRNVVYRENDCNRNNKGKEKRQMLRINEILTLKITDFSIFYTFFITKLSAKDFYNNA